MTTVLLDDRTAIRVAGPDAEHLLQNIVTTDLDALPQGVAKAGALLTPQGKIQFDFLISREGPDGFILDSRSSVADDLMRRLMLYRLRAKADIAKQDQYVVRAAWGDESGASSVDSNASATDSTPLTDSRFPADRQVRRLYGSDRASDALKAEWERLRIVNGIAESGSDYDLGDAFPHDVLLDQLGGVGFKKGCYVGQEVVSRMQHRGTARRRLLLVAAAADLPAPRTDLTADGKPVGVLGSVAGTHGLAICRIDKVADAMNSGLITMAGDIPVTLAIAGWANFSWPGSEQADG